jgi:hypothetical protein
VNFNLPTVFADTAAKLSEAHPVWYPFLPEWFLGPGLSSVTKRLPPYGAIRRPPLRAGFGMCLVSSIFFGSAQTHLDRGSDFREISCPRLASACDFSFVISGTRSLHVYELQFAGPSLPYSQKATYDTFVQPHLEAHSLQSRRFSS